MSIMDGIKSVLGLSSAKASVAPSREPTPLGGSWVPSSPLSPLFGLDDSWDDYDNVFPYVNAIAQRFSTIVPYAVDGRGNRIEPAPSALSALYQPNNAFSAREFLKFIAVSLLTQDHLDILIWTRRNGRPMPGGKVTRDNIAGYSFLPPDSRSYTDSRSDYTLNAKILLNGQLEPLEFTRDEAIALTYSRHPVDPTMGISPAMTVKKWASVDDMIADYEQGFFANGAIPSGTMSIVSENQADFERTVAQLKTAFQGADNANGIVYSYKPVDPVTHKPTGAGKLEWTPFQQPNTSLDLKTVSDVATNRLSKSMGTPSIMMGIDDSQTYANAQQAERIFIENTLQPLLMTVWDKFQFELDRITGGLGYSITFELNLPTQTDVESVQAATQSTQVNSLISLVNAGATPMEAAKALGLSEDYGNLTLKAPDAEQSPAVADESTPQAKTAGGVQEPVAVDSAYAKNMTGSRGEAYKQGYKAAMTMLDSCVEYVLGEGVLDRTSQTPGSIALEWLNGALAAYQPRIIEYAEQTGRSIADSVKELAKTDPAIRDILDNYTEQQLKQLYTWEDMPDEYEDAYHSHLQLVANDTVQNGISKVQDILQQADSEGWTRAETESALRAFVTGARAESLARNELNKAEKLGSLYSALHMSEEMGVKLEKYWKTTGPHPCPVCTELNGTVIGLDDTFMDVGDSLEIDGKSYVNDFESKTTADGHPNCLCVTLYRVVGTNDGVADD